MKVIWLKLPERVEIGTIFAGIQRLLRVLNAERTVSSSIYLCQQRKVDKDARPVGDFHFAFQHFLRRQKRKTSEKTRKSRQEDTLESVLENEEGFGRC